MRDTAQSYKRVTLAGDVGFLNWPIRPDLAAVRSGLRLLRSTYSSQECLQKFRRIRDEMLVVLIDGPGSENGVFTDEGVSMFLSYG